MKKGITDYKYGALFDLDGVVFNTEPQYTRFWKTINTEFCQDVKHLEQRIKGQTLKEILSTWFRNRKSIQEEIVKRLNVFESKMQFNYVKGLRKFVNELRAEGFATAIVTSSNEEKMQKVYEKHPEITTLFDEILTAENFTHSKPDPDCYLLGAKNLGIPPYCCVVFEDSFNGLLSGRSARMKTIGLATTNSTEMLVGLCDVIVKDFTELTATKICMMINGECNANKSQQ